MVGSIYVLDDSTLPERDKFSKFDAMVICDVFSKLVDPCYTSFVHIICLML